MEESTKGISEIDIVNSALAELGDGLAVNLDDENNADVVSYKKLVESCLRNELARFNWSWAERIVELSKIDAEPIPPYQYVYNDPDDRLGVLEVYMGDENDGFYWWGDASYFISQGQSQDATSELLFANNRIYSNLSPLWVKYQRSIPIEKAPDDFIVLLEAAVAVRISARNSGSVSQRIQDHYDNTLFEIRNQDRKLRPGLTDTSTLLSLGHGGYGGW